MANPQPTEFTKISNELMEHFSMLSLSPNEWKIIWAVLRKTYGWNRKEDCISFSQFEEITNLSRPNVSRAIKSLVAKQLLVVAKQLPSNRYGIQKDWEKWQGGSYTATSSRLATRVVVTQLPELVATQLPTKEIKEIITKENNIDAKASGNEPEFLFWTEKIGTKIRTKFEENIKAAHRLKEKLTRDEFIRAIETVRIARADAYAGKLLHTTGNYIQLEKNLEAVEAYRLGLEERSHFNKANRKKVVSI